MIDAAARSRAALIWRTAARATAATIATVSERWRVLWLLAGAELLAMTLWFSATAVAPQLAAAHRLSDAGAAWLTMSVQIGFVTGALAAAVTNLADRFRADRVIAVAALAGAAINAGIAAVPDQLPAILAMRFLTGVTLAGVYPPGMKVLASWFDRGRGLALGIMVGALAVGSAGPHLLGAWPADGSWRSVVVTASILAAAGGLIALGLVRCGPLLPPASPFDWRYAGRIFTDRGLRLANFGYLGHMWELYAVWTWVPATLLAAYARGGLSEPAARVAGFAVIAAGAPGCVVAGRLADRLGRTVVAGASLAVSGGCCLIAGTLLDTPAVLTVVALVWGFAVVADSAQFSAAVSELADPRYVGTALTMQTCTGFLLTMASIRLVPVVESSCGWSWAFAMLAAGPAFGIASMARLRCLPEARRLAGGRR